MSAYNHHCGKENKGSGNSRTIEKEIVIIYSVVSLTHFLALEDKFFDFLKFLFDRKIVTDGTFSLIKINLC